jgi:hypothetical protein
MFPLWTCGICSAVLHVCGEQDLYINGQDACSCTGIG